MVKLWLEVLFSNQENMMRAHTFWNSFIIGVGICAVLNLATAAAEPKLEFNRDIRPILSENCFYCHGQDANQRKADLRLDERAAAITESNGVAAIVPGSPEKSEIITRLLTNDADELMPPPESHRTVTPEQIEKLKRWITEGAEYERHWSFIPPKIHPLPAVSNSSWARQPLDHFVLKKLDDEKLTPSAEASTRDWLRRVSFDLTGLPPTAAQLDAFASAVAREGESAYEKAVDHLLASPAYGERMASDWLDAARYADTHGFNNDSTRTMWRWRDWVIEAFNQNLSYDQFITHQLAGDLLPNPTLEQKLATGFGRNHVINSEGGIIEEEYRVEYVADRVRTTSLAWLGLTMECARCHDHKYDPITTKNYYELFAFFNNVNEFGEDGRVANAVPMIPAPTREQLAQLAATQKNLDQIETALRKHEQIHPPGAIDRAIVKKEVSKAQERLSRVASVNSYPAENAVPVQDQLLFPKGAPTLTAGVIGQAWVSTGQHPVAEFPISKNGKPATKKPVSWSFFLQVAADNPADVALVSNQGYGGTRAGAGYRSGIELRLINGKLEYTIATHYPSYALRVITMEPLISPGGWHHIVVRQDGGEKAANTQIFIDGHEAELTVLNDGLSGKISDEPYWLGADRREGSAVKHFRGAFDEVRFYQRLLSAEEIADLAHHGLWSQALNAEHPSTLEKARLQEATTRTSDLAYADLSEKRERLWQEQLQLQRQFPTAMIMTEEATRQAYVLKRGAYDAHGEPVSAGVPEEIISPWPAGAPRNRLGLAQWFTQPNHPLTARVVVNRFWAQFFGTGLVKTQEDFGFQSEWPSHPELLDYLARNFIDQGWNVKGFLKKIALSSTYRQSSAASPPLLERDPENRLLARGPRLRLQAEFIRDQALAVSGLLTRQIGGPSVFPYQPADLYKGVVVGADYPGTTWVESTGPDLYRRSLYTFWKRTVPHPTMLTFDAPDREFCSVRRSRTNTPLQALALQNDPTFLEAARLLAEKVIKDVGSDPRRLCEQVMKLVLGRKMTSTEQQTLQQTYERFHREFSADEAAAKAFLTVGATPSDASLKTADLATAASLAGLILNLDETITKQ
jgi:hypothetical protein